MGVSGGVEAGLLLLMMMMMRYVRSEELIDVHGVS